MKKHLIPLIGVIVSALIVLAFFHYVALDLVSRVLEISPDNADQAMTALFIVAALLRCLLIINDKDDITTWINKKSKK